MLSTFIATSLLARFASAQAVHGTGALGTTMGPVAFLWPADRAWDAAHDNNGPCGSNAPIVNRTDFPLGAVGSIETTIADDAYNMAVRIAYGNNPTTQDQFQPVIGNVAELEPGHQCYSVSTAPTATPGSNATIQLEYWADDSGTQESFFACADVTFVEAATFSLEVPCFNVTEDEFMPVDPASPTTPATTTPVDTLVSADKDDNDDDDDDGLSTGAKAGIAVGAIAGALLLAAAAFFLIRRKRSAAAKETEALPPMGKVSDAASIGSAQTARG
ncbi:uncharacterized protein L3040_002658 [Drepanopeziza brunnea f. sp. 'multigermtubi']|uniref:Copper acquisition factor BIM1-like domain-containing protein n=1 Tax=Marssonina brunnea f. sp. multigermtubi (strain MB_m1) TaxID=1072389 RepID=K1X2L1_MARBU|nr:uncharacterized protein MBM_02703 [Drepanopeziza brunnea f. sp. 'multigermtubi' MB_m1]EKD19466.1 hypothetical protein MBM_02703 [Drepanopeziza brunnea f. sp. 'multigermtubi' MB_m1]KAJ5050788.1 hypothetical protein L3040_002658 [Drepanopeziza brunnea f. sp. 'multigermtubi']